MVDYEELKRLAGVYRAMWSLDNELTPQKRGQDFNHLVADVLRAYGVEARASKRRRQGEIDVYFTLKGVRFILEAKWEAGAVDEGVVSKLATRVRQSLQGTQGVVLSVGGFKDEALSGAGVGERLSVVMADAQHFEALVAGVVTPEELFDGLLDGASFLGEPYTPLIDIITTEDPGDSSGEVSFDFRDCPPLVHAGSTEHVERLLCQLDWSQHGVVLRAGRVILTTGRGLIEVDVENRRSYWILRSRWCQNSAAILDDGRVVVVRRSGLIIIDTREERLEVLGGGLEGNIRIFESADREIWASANGGMYNFRSPVTLTKFGSRVGEERTHRIEGGVAEPGSAVVVAHSGDAIFVITQMKITKLEFDSREELASVVSKGTELVNPGGLVHAEGRLFAVVETATIVEFDLMTLEMLATRRVQLGGSTFNLCSAGPQALLLSAPCIHGSELPHQAVVRVEC